MGTLILDQTQDLTGKEQYRLLSCLTPPAFVKSASYAQLCPDIETLPLHAFGDPSRRLYPCHTKAATWLSAAFFADKQQDCGEHVNTIANRIKAAAVRWGIVDEIAALFEKYAEFHEPEEMLPDDAFALVYRDGDTAYRQCPLRNAGEVKTAAAWFDKHRDQFGFRDRYTVAGRILRKLEEFDTYSEHRESLEKAAGYGYCSNTDVADAWETRAKLANAKYPQLAQQASQLAKTVRQQSFGLREHGIRIKLAEHMEQFDHETGLTSLYGDGLARPEDVLFMLTQKVASDVASQYVQTTTGKVYEKQAFAGISPQDLDEWLGADFVEECGGDELSIEKLAEVVPTLPRPEAVLFDQLAASLEILPVTQEKTAGFTALTPEQVDAYAAQYASQQR